MSWKFGVDDLSYCIRIGQQRQATNVKNGVPSKQFTQRNPTNIHIQGVLGEYAFAKMCAGLSTDKKDDVMIVLNNTQSRSAKHDTFDWSVFGKKVDVKTTLYPYGYKIYARQHKYGNPADLYVLILIEFIDPKTNQTVYSQNKDDLFDQCQKDPNKFHVKCTFRGSVLSAKLFQSINLSNDGSFVADAQIKQWSDFCAQFSAPVERTNKDVKMMSDG